MRIDTVLVWIKLFPFCRRGRFSNRKQTLFSSKHVPHILQCGWVTIIPAMASGSDRFGSRSLLVYLDSRLLMQWWWWFGTALDLVLASRFWSGFWSSDVLTFWSGPFTVVVWPCQQLDYTVCVCDCLGVLVCDCAWFVRTRDGKG